MKSLRNLRLFSYTLLASIGYYSYGQTSSFLGKTESITQEQGPKYYEQSPDVLYISVNPKIGGFIMNSGDGGFSTGGDLNIHKDVITLSVHYFYGDEFQIFGKSSSISDLGVMIGANKLIKDRFRISGKIGASAIEKEVVSPNGSKLMFGYSSYSTKKTSSTGLGLDVSANLILSKYFQVGASVYANVTNGDAAIFPMLSVGVGYLRD